MTDQEQADLARFLDRVRDQWVMRNNAEARKAFEAEFADMLGATFSGMMWKGQYNDLLATLDARVARAAEGFEEDRRTLARVRRFYDDSRGRKTVSREALGVIVSRCDTCGRGAARMWNGRPVCQEDYDTLMWMERA
jgi:hypothetical protein